MSVSAAQTSFMTEVPALPVDEPVSQTDVTPKPAAKTADEPAANVEEEAAGDMDDPFAMLGGMGGEEVYKVTLIEEATPEEQLASQEAANDNAEKPAVQVDVFLVADSSAQAVLLEGSNQQGHQESSDLLC